MSRVLNLLFIVTSYAIPKSHDKNEKYDKHPSCQEFTQGLSFNDSQALGTWHLLHFKTEKTNGSGDSHCVQFSSVSDQIELFNTIKSGLPQAKYAFPTPDVDFSGQYLTHNTPNDRKDLKELIEKYVENLKWENLSLKMQIPCETMKSNKTRDYYLEKLEGDGSYRTLQMPAPTAKMDISGFHRYPMRLKIVEGQYLGMMDCHEKFVFLLGKQPPAGTELDERLKKMIESYWPEEH